MSETFLDKVTAGTRERIARVKSDHYQRTFRKRADISRQGAQAHRLRGVLARNDEINVIAEIKRASPSKGVINARLDVASQARRYEAGGAAGVSVLTEPTYFLGSMRDLVTVRRAVDVPILRKDFIVDELQVYEAAAAGADAVLLIVSAFDNGTLPKILGLIEHDYGMDALVEVHTRDELSAAIDAGASIVGVNNRDLRSLEVSLDTSRDLIRYKPRDVLFVAESGISLRDEIEELHALGFNGFLLGEALMRSENVVETLGGLIDG